MNYPSIGEFEELVLLVVGALHDEAYGVSIQEHLAGKLSKPVNISAVHVALKRMEDKGFVKSRYGGITEERGGRRKRIFQVTVAGSRLLHEVRDVRNNLWSRIAPRSLPKVKTT